MAIIEHFFFQKCLHEHLISWYFLDLIEDHERPYPFGELRRSLALCWEASWYRVLLGVWWLVETLSEYLRPVAEGTNVQSVSKRSRS